MKESTKHLCRALISLAAARQSDDCTTDLQHTVEALHSEIMHNESCTAADVYVLAQEVSRQEAETDG